MERASQLRRFSGIALLTVITSLLGACGGGSEPAPAGGGSGPPVGTNSVTLEWDTVMDPDLAGYRVYIGVSPGTYIGYVNAGVSNPYTVTGLRDGTYYFAATAYDTLNNESTFSNEISRTLP